MSGYELVRVWKDAEERGDTAHPSGEIHLAALSGGAAAGQAYTLPNTCHPWVCGPSIDYTCPLTIFPTCGPPEPRP